MPGPVRLLFLLVLALSVVLPLRTWVAEPIIIASPSMEPTLKVGTLLLLDKWTLARRGPRRGDVVSLLNPIGGEDLVKRVIAAPGETVELRGKSVFIDGRTLEEPYAVHSRPGERLEGDDLAPLVVPEGCYFVLGDNRDESKDSSVWKSSSGERIYFVRKEALQGFVRRLPWAE